MAGKAGLVTLEQIALQAGLKPSVLNYYANLGLLQVADRRGNRRLFRRTDTLRRLKAVKRFRKEGYPLRIIRKQLEERSAA